MHTHHHNDSVSSVVSTSEAPESYAEKDYAVSLGRRRDGKHVVCVTDIYGDVEHGCIVDADCDPHVLATAIGLLVLALFDGTVTSDDIGA